MVAGVAAAADAVAGTRAAGTTTREVGTITKVAGITVTSKAEVEAVPGAEVEAGTLTQL